jgi:photosystem II stability/assembly factor-like uncharacterized protein
VAALPVEASRQPWGSSAVSAAAPGRRWISAHSDF